MMTHSQWIWLETQTADQYAEFYDSFILDGKDVHLFISADSNYAVYLNGHLTAFGQYPDFPWYKVYDDIKLTTVCQPGRNHLAIVVWYYGKSNMSYYPGKAALRYEVRADETVFCASGSQTLSRQSLCYQTGLEKDITSQLGFSFRYDMTREDGWKLGKTDGFAPSRIVKQEGQLFPRPVQRTVIHPAVPAKIVRQDSDSHLLVDLGREEAGYLSVCIHSSVEQDVQIAYGEHIVDGGVRRIIGSRDFSVDIRLRKGQNEYVNPFRRLGLRYLELFAEAPVEVEQLTVLPAVYPVQLSSALPIMNEQQKNIYDVCVRTLQLCMHEHYEDTPWREQALYAMDSRNQMLCGYFAFHEFTFARANLLLMSKDNRADGLLSICTPSADDLTIPSFSLHYFTEVWEYTRYSGDLSLAREIWPKLTGVLAVFLNRLEDGLVPVFAEKCHWNFYEWTEGMSGKLRQHDEKRFDAALNCLLSLALQSMQKLADLLKLPADYAKQAERINEAVHLHFFDEKRGIFKNSTADDHGSVLVNALAILCGAADANCTGALAEHLTDTEYGLTPVSLSMVCFLYDALLAVDRTRYASFVLQDIACKYQRMLDAGATSFWETEKGESDFDNAGSLCHGWTAMPVYYYHQLLPHT